jgi:hypothetical protein
MLRGLRPWVAFKPTVCGEAGQAGRDRLSMRRTCWREAYAREAGGQTRRLPASFLVAPHLEPCLIFNQSSNVAGSTPRSAANPRGVLPLRSSASVKAFRPLKGANSKAAELDHFSVKSFIHGHLLQFCKRSARGAPRAFNYPQVLRRFLLVFNFLALTLVSC